MLRTILRGAVQLPREQWGTEGLPFNELAESPYDSWDIVESVAARLGVAVRFEGDVVRLWLDGNNNGSFDNSSGGIELAMKFLGGCA